MIRLKVWLAFWLINACRLSVISNCLFSVAQLRTDTRSVSPAGVWILEMYEWVKSAGWDCISVTTLIYHSIVFGRLALILSRHHWDNCPAFFPSETWKETNLNTMSAHRAQADREACGRCHRTMNYACSMRLCGNNRVIHYANMLNGMKLSLLTNVCPLWEGASSGIWHAKRAFMG